MASTHDAADRHLETLVSNPDRRRELLADLGPPERRHLLRQVQSHVDVHLAQGHRLAARVLLGLAAEVAGSNPDLQYAVEKSRIRWLEQEGLTLEALTALARLYESYQRSRRHPQRGAELAMELGIMLDRSGHKPEALKLFRSAAARYQRLGQAYNRAAAVFNGASVQYDLGRIGPSLRSCRQALQEGGAGHPDLEAHITLQMANSLEADGDLAAASDCYQKAADGYRQLNNRKQESNIRYRLGWLSLQGGRTAEAEPELQQALQVKREHDYGEGLARYHLHRAESYRTAGLPELARYHYRACLGLGVALGAESLATRARFGLCLVAGAHKRSLPSYLKLPAPPGGETSLSRGRKGIYCEHVGDGGRLDLWRQSGEPEAPPEDRTFLARLLKDLGHSLDQLGSRDTEPLRRQERAVEAWQTRTHKPRRAGPGASAG